MKFLRYLIIVAALAVSGCANFSQTSQSISYAIHYSSPDRVRFSGRGAGAGVMLAGSMGAMGIAIGVAIDEGIAKDIGEAAESGGVSFDQIFREEMQLSSSAPINWVPLDQADAVRLYSVDAYGFVSVRGSSDEVYPSIELTLIEAGEEYQIRLPDDFSDTPEILPRTSFDAIKNDAAEIERLWRSAVKLAAGALHQG